MGMSQCSVICEMRYHKGLGRWLGAFPSDTGIFTTGNGPGKFIGPINFQIPELKIHRFSVIPSKMLKNPQKRPKQAT